LHSEVATLPRTFKEKGIRECFFKINYWGMAKETVEKVRVLAEFGFNSTVPVEVRGQKVVPRDFLVAMMAKFVPPVTAFLEPPTNQPPDWAKEIVTEVKGTQGGQEMVYRLSTVTLKGALPTGAAPAITAIWLAEGRIPAGVHPPEQVIDPEPFFTELANLGIETRVTVTRPL
jgi:saccharopine dehydrogenase-like NADP-dependent oxidoreductase